MMLRETIIPVNILRELEALGLRPENREPKTVRPKPDFKFNMPNLDENGEPDF